MSLRQLVRRDDVSDMLLGYVQAAMITSGPWIMTVAAVAAVSLLGLDYVDPHDDGRIPIDPDLQFRLLACSVGSDPARRHPDSGELAL